MADFPHRRVRLLTRARVVGIMKRTPLANNDAPMSWRLLCGALAGMAATAPMTAAMRRFHGKLPQQERYPLPPREIVSSAVPALAENAARNSSILAHFAYGALSGAALAALRRKPTLGFERFDRVFQSVRQGHDRVSALKHSMDRD